MARKRSQTRFLARMIDGSKPSDMPGFIKPQLAKLVDAAPAGDGWLHEIKFDGYRLQLHVRSGRVITYTRGGLDWTKRFAGIADAAGALPIDKVILDGEVVVEQDGRSNFSALQAELKAGRQDRLAFYAFDLLFLDGFDLRGSPLVERRRILRALLEEAEAKPPLFLSEHFDVPGPVLFEHACRLQLEGIISKRADAPYRSERSSAWLKIKCARRGEFVIVGFEKDAGGIAALHLAERHGKRVQYVGKVGTGFTRKTSAELRRKLDAIATDASVVKVRARSATWVQPSLVAEIEYRDITSDGRLRHSAFKGLV